MRNFSKKLNVIAKNTNSYIKNFLSKQEKNSYLIRPMNYGILSGGKRLRSAIIVSFGKIFNINYKNLIIIGSAVECIHSYSLIHDDLPCMDNDDLRRGKPSTHKKFGESTAILAGNSLLTMAFEILSSKELKLSKKIKLELIKSLSNCSGHSGIAGGQYYDLYYEKKKIPKKNIIKMQIKKTAKLFGFCCESIGIITNNKKRERNLFKTIGEDIGLLFQIKDDLIDYTGKSRIVGKKTKLDKKKGKANLVNLMGYNKTFSYAQILKKKIDKKIKKYGNKADDLLDSVNFVLNREY